MGVGKVSVGALVFLFVIFLGGIIYSNLEGWSFIDSVYFSAVTITTLGYGDFVPQTQFGKLFTIVFSVSGIAIGLYILTMLGKSFFTIDLHRGKKVLVLRKGKKFDIEKMNVGMLASYRLNNKEILQGIVYEIGLDYIRLKIEKRDNKLLPKKDQKIIVINSDGKLRKE